MFKLVRWISLTIAAFVVAFSMAFSVASFTGGTLFYAVSSVVTGLTGFKSHPVRQKEEIASLKTDIDGELRRSANLADELDDTRLQASQLETDLKTERRLRSELTDELADVDARRVRAVAQLDELNLELDTERRLRSEVQEELAESRTVARILREELSDELIEYRGTRRTMKEAVSDTYMRLSTRSERIVSREAKGMFAEAVPYFGTAAIVALTTLEIRDLCEMMRDSNELYFSVNPDERPEDDTPTVCSVEIPTKMEIWEAARSAPGAAFESTQVYLDDTVSGLSELDQSDLWNFGLLVVEKSANSYESGKEAIVMTWTTLADLWRYWNK